MANRWGVQLFSEPNNWHEQAEKDLGHSFECGSIYGQLPEAQQFLRGGNLKIAQDRGMQIYLNINHVELVGGRKRGLDYDKMLAGDHDSYIKEWADALNSLGLKRAMLIVTWQHEPSVANGNQPKTGDHSGPKYQQAFRYFFEHLAKEGCDKDKYRIGFYPVVANFSDHKGHTIADEYYPGDDLVDVIGADIYNHADSQDAEIDKVGEFLAYVKAHGKRGGVGECGDTDEDGRPDRLKEVAKALYDAGLVHVNWNGKSAYGLTDHSGATYAAWLEAAKPYYA